MDLSLKALSSKAKKSKEESDNSNEESPKKKDMGLFISCYNRYLKRKKLNHFDKGLINFKKYLLPKIEHKKKDEGVTCYE